MLDYNGFREKVYYVEKRKFIKYALISLIVFALFKASLIYSSKIANDVISIFRLIIIIILLMLSTHLGNITGKKIYKIMRLFLFTMFVFTIIFLTPQNYLENVKDLLVRIGYKSYFGINFLNRIMLYYVIAKHRISKKKSNIIFEYLVLFIITSFLNYINKQNIYYLNNLAGILLLIGTHKEFYKKDLKFENKIDLIRLNVNITTIAFISNIFLSYKSVSSFNIALRSLENILFISSIFIIMDNIVKENYNLVFKETINTNKKLGEINEKIINNNHSLEEAYQNLSKKQFLYKEFLKSSPSPIVIIHNNLRIYYCNKSFLNVIEQDNLRDVVNKKIDNYINFNYDIDNVIKNIGEKQYSIAVDKGNKNMEARFFPLYSEKSKCVVLLKDLTENVKLNSMKREFESIKIKEQIRSDFLSNISHDLKIPVSVIYSAVQLQNVLIENNNVEKIQYYNKINEKNCFDLTRIVDNIIDISKIDSKNLQTNLVLYNIVEFIEDYLCLLTPYVTEKGINVVFDTDEEEVFVYFDKEMMQRIISNLIINSLKFTNGGGEIFVNIKDGQDVVSIEFGDTGSGMSQDLIKKAFENYGIEDRIKNNKESFGIGLLVVYNLVKAQNGEIQINSSIKKGTIVTINLNK